LGEVVGKDFGNSARQVVRILYTTEEFKICILSPKRLHLARESLDSEHFRLLNGLLKVSFLSFQFYLCFFRSRSNEIPFGSIFVRLFLQVSSSFETQRFPGRRTLSRRKKILENKQM
jgi:hypothetical protein